MKRASYPFSAIVSQALMKQALLLAAVDWRLGVLLRGDKGSGKTTTARALAALLPEPAPFVNLPLGVTEDRLLGGLHLERTMQGDPALKPGLLADAHGGVLYIDEVNLLPPHLGDALLDAAASGVHVLEREGFSASHAAEFILLGSMNPEEGSLRPQLLDRFAFSVDVAAPVEPAERMKVVERRLAFERDAERFAREWEGEEAAVRGQIAAARERLASVECSSDVMAQISQRVCAEGVRSLRADLALLRGAIACAALQGEAQVREEHVDAVVPLVLGHRVRAWQEPQARAPQVRQPKQPESEQPSSRQDAEPQRASERVFAAEAVPAPAVRAQTVRALETAGRQKADGGRPGPVTHSRASATPGELDVRGTLVHALRENGSAKLAGVQRYERVRAPRGGTRFLFVIDSSGSHAAQQRMRQVKGAVLALLERSFGRQDEVAVIVFRGTAAEVIVEPTSNVEDAAAALEYVPTGGRTPLAAGLSCAAGYVTPETVLLLLTDGRANVPLQGEDPWQEALDLARRLRCPAAVVDTETGPQRLGRCEELAEAMGARCVSLDELAALETLEV